MIGRESPGLIPFAGHRFDIHIDDDFRLDQLAHLINFAPEAAPASPCGEVTRIKVRHNRDLFADRLARLASARSLLVVPFRGEPYRLSHIGDVSWWQPDPEEGLPQDHLYAKDSAGRLHIVLRPGAERGERYLMRVVREVVLRCAENRGWTTFHAAAAAIDGQGVLIVGPSGAGKTTVLTALAAHRRADLIASDRAVVTDRATTVVGVPLSVRIAAGTLSALAPMDRLPPHRLLPKDFGTTHKAASTPHDFAHAFAARVAETASLRLAVIPQLRNDDSELSITFPDPAAARATLIPTCCTPCDEDWLHPWFADRTRCADDLCHQAAELIADLTEKVPVMKVTVGVHTPHLLERIADTVTRRL